MLYLIGSPGWLGKGVRPRALSPPRARTPPDMKLLLILFSALMAVVASAHNLRAEAAEGTYPCCTRSGENKDKPCADGNEANKCPSHCYRPFADGPCDKAAGNKKTKAEFENGVAVTFPCCGRSGSNKDKPCADGNANSKCSSNCYRPHGDKPCKNA